MGKTRASDVTEVAVLAGGGIDSTLCMHLMSADGVRVRAIHVDYGQPASLLEWAAVEAAAKRASAAADQISVRGRFAFEVGEIPGRNAALVFLALMHLHPAERILCIGIHAGTPFWDCSESFFLTVSRMVAEQTDSRVRVVAPLVALHKPEIVALARSRGLPLDETYSCQRGEVGGCGACHSCLDRRALGC